MTISRRQFLGAFGSTAAMALSGPRAASAKTIGSELPAVGVPESQIRLDRNENPFGCADSVTATIRTATPHANRYPDADYTMLKHRLGSLHRIKPDQVVLGAGSVEVLQMAANAFLNPGQNVVVAQPTYAAVASQAKMLGAEVREVRLAPTWAHDLTAMRNRVDEKTRLVYICNPNNPTGSITPRKDIDAFLGSLPESVYILIDEAYHQYVSPSGSYSSFLQEPSRNPRVIVVRTFSTIYGLAGMRVGYGVASPEVAGLMRTRQLANGVGTLASLAALAALDDTHWIETCIKQNEDSRQEFLNQANVRMLRTIDSHGNFAMLNVMIPAERVIDHYAKNGVLLPPKYPPLDKYVRVSFGTPEEMKTFWRLWDGMHIDMQM